MDALGLALGALVCAWAVVVEGCHLCVTLFRLTATGAPMVRE